jgi:hypothetical protein
VDGPAVASACQDWTPSDNWVLGHHLRRIRRVDGCYFRADAPMQQRAWLFLSFARRGGTISRRSSPVSQAKRVEIGHADFHAGAGYADGVDDELKSAFLSGKDVLDARTRAWGSGGLLQAIWVETPHANDSREGRPISDGTTSKA